MNRKPTRTLQRLLFRLPAKLRRIKVAQWLGLRVMRTARHELDFGAGVLVGDIRDRTVVNALVKKTFADYGYHRLARNLLAAGGTHVDVGANFGFQAFGLAANPALRGIGHILVEANPECCACLEFSRALHPEARSVLHRCAVGRAEGRLRLAFQPGLMGSGQVSAVTDGNAAGADGETVVEVPCRRLDDILTETGADKIRLMKMDIEGSETAALAGAERYLAEGRMEYIYVEVNGPALRDRQTSTAELLGLLTAAGYQLFWPHDDLRWPRAVCGREFDRREEKFARLPGPDGLLAMVFDPARHILPADCQLDLLAVHRSQELVSGS